MDMKFVGIVVAVIIVFGVVYYFFLSPEGDTPDPNDGKACKTADGKDGFMKGGICVNSQQNPKPILDPNPVVVTLPLKTGSTSVNISDTAQAVINFSGLKEDNMVSYNVLTSAGSNPIKIHYVTGFASSCPQYIWYKNWLYSYRGTEQDQSGNKTCYYGINKSILPSSLDIQLTGLTCANFQVYVSGIEYKYDKTIIKGGGLTTSAKTYCVYNKQ